MPEPRGGGIIKDQWWQLWDQPSYPPVEFVIAALDTAYTTKTENDPSAVACFGVWAGNNTESQTTRTVDRYGRTTDATVSYSSGDLTATPKAMLMYAWQQKLELHDLVAKVVETCRKMKVDLLLIENKAAGHSVAQELRRLFQNENFSVQMYDPGGLDKVVRLYAVQHLFQEKMVYAPDKDWAEMVIRQVSIFPKGAHDDLVDCVSMCLQHIRNVGMLTRAPEVLAQIEGDKQHHGAEPPPLYGV
jgi:predicted phage terminase large subunit-like protein